MKNVCKARRVGVVRLQCERDIRRASQADGTLYGVGGDIYIYIYTYIFLYLYIYLFICLSAGLYEEFCVFASHLSDNGEMTPCRMRIAPSADGSGSWRL